MIKLVVSGGQRGADLAGLDAAKALGIPTGGTAPKGYRICDYDGNDSSDPSLAEYGLVEHSSRDYPPRTRQNVIDSDGTVWFGFTESRGAKLTINTAKKLNKPILINPHFVDQFWHWVNTYDIESLNVAGNRLSKDNPTIYNDTYNFLVKALGRYVK